MIHLSKTKTNSSAFCTSKGIHIDKALKVKTSSRKLAFLKNGQMPFWKKTICARPSVFTKIPSPLSARLISLKSSATLSSALLLYSNISGEGSTASSSSKTLNPQPARSANFSTRVSLSVTQTMIRVKDQERASRSSKRVKILGSFWISAKSISTSSK